MKQQMIFVLLFFGLVGCATTHPGNIGTPTSVNRKIPITVSAQSIDASSRDVFQLVEITVENNSDSWVRFSREEVAMSDELKTKLSVVLGRDLHDWGQAKAFQLNKDEHNRGLLQGAVLGVGIVAAGSNNSDTSALGAAAFAGGYVWAVSDIVKADFRKAEGVKGVPENHFYSPYSVPPRMFIRRWLLLNKPVNALVTELVVEFETVEGERERYAVNLK
jgi:hypothetical protein